MGHACDCVCVGGGDCNQRKSVAKRYLPLSFVISPFFIGILSEWTGRGLATDIYYYAYLANRAFEKWALLGGYTIFCAEDRRRAVIKTQQ